MKEGNWELKPGRRGGCAWGASRLQKPPVPGAAQGPALLGWRQPEASRRKGQKVWASTAREATGGTLTCTWSEMEGDDKEGYDLTSVWTKPLAPALFQPPLNPASGKLKARREALTEDSRRLGGMREGASREGRRIQSASARAVDGETEGCDGLAPPYSLLCHRESPPQCLPRILWRNSLSSSAKGQEYSPLHQLRRR